MNPLPDRRTEYPHKTWGLHVRFWEISAVLLISGLFYEFLAAQMFGRFTMSVILCATTFDSTANKILRSLALADMLLVCLCWWFLPDYATLTLVLPPGIVPWLLPYNGGREPVLFSVVVCFSWLIFFWLCLVFSDVLCLAS